MKCLVEGCTKKPRTKTVDGYCSMHYGRLWRRGDLIRTRTNGKRENGVRQPRDRSYKGDDGYIRIYDPTHPMSNKQGYIKYHRYVMAEYLGRPLEEHENVHHLNGDRADNRIENLELWTISQPRGQRVEDKIKWAKEFLEGYGYEVKDTTGQKSCG